MKQMAMQRRAAARPKAQAAGVSLEGPRQAQLAAMSAQLNRQPAVQRQSGVAASALQASPNQTGLPDRLKAGVEAMSGLSMDHVRVHRNSPKPAALQANAYAQGGDIHLGPGQERHLPHEAWHVVQQAQGRVRATRQMSGGTPINDDAGLEREADVMGARALHAGGGSGSSVQRVAAEHGDAVIQGIGFTELLGAAASKLVGNTASDWLIKGGIAAVSSISSRLHYTALNQPWYGPLTGRGFGTAAEIRSDMKVAGTPPNPPNNPTYDALNTRRTSGNVNYYAQGHLINQDLGGPGVTWQNLVPLTRKTNAHHSNQVEQKVKDHITKGNTVDFRAQAIYGRWPWHWPNYLVNLTLAGGGKYLLRGTWSKLLALKDAEQHVPAQIDCDWWLPDGKHFQKTVHQEPNSESGFYVNVDGTLRNLAIKSAIFDLIESGLAIAIKTYLGPALIPYLGGKSIALVEKLSSYECLNFVVNAVGGREAIISRLANAQWEPTKFMTTLNSAVLATIAELVMKSRLRLSLPSLAPEDPTPANREAISTRKNLKPDQIATIKATQNDPRDIGERISGGLYHRRTAKRDFKAFF